MKAKLQLVMVEDTDADAELVARNLAKAGLDVDMHRVETEPDFVQALQEIGPDVILSDFSLPQFDGLRALEIAGVHVPDTPFIFVSGTIGEERAIDALRRGATDYVLKTNLSRLSTAVERALRDEEMKVLTLGREIKELSSLLDRLDGEKRDAEHQAMTSGHMLQQLESEMSRVGERLNVSQLELQRLAAERAEQEGILCAR